MIEHLPECPLFRPCRGNANGMHIPQGTVAGIPVTICGMCMHDCICPALRACTVRVLGEARGAVAAEAVNPWPVQNEFDVAYIAGHEDQMRDVLAAIDRLAQEAP